MANLSFLEWKTIEATFKLLIQGKYVGGGGGAPQIADGWFVCELLSHYLDPSVASSKWLNLFYFKSFFYIPFHRKFLDFSTF
jgi:hypothetical protein